MNTIIPLRRQAFKTPGYRKTKPLKGLKDNTTLLACGLTYPAPSIALLPRFLLHG